MGPVPVHFNDPPLFGGDNHDPCWPEPQANNPANTSKIKPETVRSLLQDCSKIVAKIADNTH